ncbi:Hpt domain-containing protein [Nitrosomonas halophila]|uniref:Hpt domain-containing protein n=1 Tax=Nitrosomonas halophila TaxID=44576 RepID=A0A1H3K687_9PROT|nr:Hpt domain-containing protein [Nitrosomonas halophila]SDY47722.1 Hpt domain-containing protein [Nitrosomonas halophila]
MNKQAVNVSLLQELVGDDQVVIDEILREFHAMLASIQNDLYEACKTGQCDRACALAHKLKSSARSVGALNLGAWCEQIEQAGRNGQTGVLHELLVGFEHELAAVESWLAHWLGID